MNIVISLDCPPEQAACVLDGIKGVLSSQGLEATHFGMGSVTGLHCFPQALAVEPQPAVEPELPPEPIVDPVAEPTVEVPAFEPELPPEVSVSPTGIVAMISPSPMGGAIGGELPAELPAEPAVIDAPQVPAFGDVRVLTLSTSFLIPTTVVPGNTVLKVQGLNPSEGIIRFMYNGFEHALPVATSADSNIANTSHSIGPVTVRLVLDIANKICPCLVDVESGDREELLVGDDLIPAIVEAAENVPTE